MSPLVVPTVGTAAIEVPLLLPVGDALNVALPVVDGAGDALDVSGISWSARVFQPSDPDWAGWSIPAGLAGTDTITLVATDTEIDAILEGRTHLRWELRNDTADRDVLRGRVERLADGWGIRSGAGGTVLQIGDTTTVLQVPAATVIGGGGAGVAGPPGPDGASAYEVAVAEGFVGTEQDWLDSLVGPTGPQGPAGPQGDPGADGADGAQGPQGIQGPAGADGADGAIGPAGPAGPQGDPGADGADGRTVLSGAGAPAGGLGVDGDFYIDTSADAIYGPKTGGAWGSGTPLIGPQGPQGIQGGQGPTGPAGADGATGPTGPEGPQGIQGEVGPAGATGPAGPGLAAGGTAGQVPAKIDGTDYNLEWVDPATGDMLAANNLSDVDDAATARTNLGALGSGSGITTVTEITQAAYDALSPPDADTLYIIVS